MITWPFGTLEFSLIENPNDSHIHIKEYLKHNIEDLCHIYLYGYVKYNQEDSTMPARITRRKPLQTPGQDQLPDDGEMEVSYDHKRKDPETRTVVIAPEKKKQKILWTSTELLHQRSIWWMMQRSRKINLEPTPIWYELDDRWIQKKAAPDIKANKTNYLLHLHCKTEAYLNIDLKDGQIFRVDSDTDTLTEDQLINNWQDFENSDHQELEQFCE